MEYILSREAILALVASGGEGCLSLVETYAACPGPENPNADIVTQFEHVFGKEGTSHCPHCLRAFKAKLEERARRIRAAR
jgi:uncharacterized Zn-finger protein